MSISASLRSVRGERQGVPKLTLDLDIESQLDVRLVILSLTAEMRVAKEMFVTDLNESYFIGMGNRRATQNTYSALSYRVFLDRPRSFK